MAEVGPDSHTRCGCGRVLDPLRPPCVYLCEWCTPNKFGGTPKDMILQALANAGGAEYLEKQAEKQARENPMGKKPKKDKP